MRPEREHLCYVYIVIGRAGTGRSLKAAAAEMQRPKATARCSGKGGKAVVDAKKEKAMAEAMSMFR